VAHDIHLHFFWPPLLSITTNVFATTFCGHHKFFHYQNFGCQHSVTKIWVTNNPFSITIILIPTIIFQSPHTIFGHQHFQLSHINQQLNFDDKKKQGVEGVLSYALMLVKFHFFCPKSLVILLGNFLFEMELQSISDIFATL
jgi:hypothetical protein